MHNAECGRGLYAAGPLKMGDLVMAVQPLAIIHGPVDDVPEADSLVPLLKQKMMGAAASGGSSSIHPSVVRAWIHQLHKGSSTIAGVEQGPLRQLQQLFLHPPSQPLPDVSVIQADIGDSDLESVVGYNAFGDAYDDLAVAAYQGGTSSTSEATSPSSSPSADAGNLDAEGAPSSATSHVGIWPHFCLLNHRCVCYRVFLVSCHCPSIHCSVHFAVNAKSLYCSCCSPALPDLPPPLHGPNSCTPSTVHFVVSQHGHVALLTLSWSSV
jgi:hypothetical protein